MTTYLITGASRGIGLELAKQLLELPESEVGKVLAVTRSEPPSALKQLVEDHQNRLSTVIADIGTEQGASKLAKDAETALNGVGLDVLVNNAGTAINGDATKPVGESMKPEFLTETLHVNVTSQHLVTASLLPLLRKGKQKKVINMSSTRGSIALAKDWPSYGQHSYRISKAAFNMLHAVYANDYRDEGFTFLAISPGWLRTDLGSEHAHLEPEVGVKEVVRLIGEANPSQNGKFLNIKVPGWVPNTPDPYLGEEIAW